MKSPWVHSAPSTLIFSAKDGKKTVQTTEKSVIHKPNPAVDLQSDFPT